MEKRSVKSGISEYEIEQMANLLHRQYGAQATEIADLMHARHAGADDPARAAAWHAVTLFLSGHPPANPVIH
ncbi:MAG: hypothetical protein K8F25_01510 [Fimbriimonadaceae bacterium]|nr:hypothetical protein [Alphaproteobacteria bacterium]